MTLPRRANPLTLVVVLFVAGCSEAPGSPSDAGVVDLGITADSSADASPDASVDAGPSCPTFTGPVEVGALMDDKLDELSGLVASREHEGVYWAHNDSGDRARFFALRETGELVATVTLEGVTARDWEDIAIIHDANGTFLTLADIGDNDRVRENVVLHRVPEPDPELGNQTVDAGDIRSLALTYPDGAHDCEAVFIDPNDGTTYFVTKELTGSGIRLYSFAAPGEGITSGTLTDLGAMTFPSGSPLGRVITAADISPDGSRVALRGYQALWMYARPAGTSIRDTLSAAPCRAPNPREMQGETVAFSADGTGVVTVSEGEFSPLWRVGW